MIARCLLTGVVVLFLVSLLTCPAHAISNPESVVAIWLFDENSGDTARDSSPNGHDGEIGDGIKWTDGQYGSKALLLPGSAAIIVPHDESLSLITWTVTAWIRADFKSGWVEFLSKSAPEGNTDFRNYVLQIEDGTGVLRPHFTRGAQQWKLVAGTTDLRDGDWHHVAGTYDQASIRAYVDGKIEGEENFDDVPDTNEEPLVIGATTPTVNFFTGAIDEVGIFDVALTEDDIQMIMKEGLANALAVSPSEKLATTWGGVKAYY